MEAKRFFEVAIPQMVLKQLDTFMSKHGTVSVSVRREGKWTLQFGNLDAPVLPKFKQDADLRLWFTPDTFKSFLDGSLQAREAMESGDFVAEGEFDLLETIGYLIRPPSNLLGVYMMR